MDILKKKEELEKIFNEKQRELQQYQAQVERLTKELIQLQGKYQLLEEMEKEMSPKKK